MRMLACLAACLVSVAHAQGGLITMYGSPEPVKPDQKCPCKQKAVPQKDKLSLAPPRIVEERETDPKPLKAALGDPLAPSLMYGGYNGTDLLTPYTPYANSAYTPGSPYSPFYQSYYPGWANMPLGGLANWSPVLGVSPFAQTTFATRQVVRREPCDPTDPNGPCFDPILAGMIAEATADNDARTGMVKGISASFSSLSSMSLTAFKSHRGLSAVEEQHGVSDSLPVFQLQSHPAFSTPVSTPEPLSVATFAILGAVGFSYRRWKS